MLFVGDDWAEDHHDVEIFDEAGKVLARKRFPEGLEGVTRLHAQIAEHAPPGWEQLDPEQAGRGVKVGIETERGPWVAALVAAGYQVFAVNPMSVAATGSGTPPRGPSPTPPTTICWRRSCAWTVPTTARSPRTDQGEAVKLVARTHQSLIWDRTRHVLRLRSTLRDFYTAARQAFGSLDDPDTLDLLAAAPDPDRARSLSRAKITAILTRANRRDVVARAVQVQAVLRAGQPRQPPMVQSAYAAIVAAEVSLIRALNSQIDELGAVVATQFGCHPDAEIYASQPGLGVILAARVLGEFGDDPHRHTDAKARKNYAGTSPITPSVRSPRGRPCPIRPQPTPGRCLAAAGLLLTPRIPRSPRPLPDLHRGIGGRGPAGEWAGGAAGRRVRQP